MSWINQACSAGARKANACAAIGLSIRTLQRWQCGEGVLSDRRPDVKRSSPNNKLSDSERDEILDVSNSEAFASLPPSQIVPKLADRGEYIASESTFYRVLRERRQIAHRGRSQRPQKRRQATTHAATDINQLWSWDISWMPTSVRGHFYYLYLVIDLYSRYAVAYDIYEVESGELAADLVTRAVMSQGCVKSPLILHSDNGSAMKSQTLLAKLYELGISPSYSRP